MKVIRAGSFVSKIVERALRSIHCLCVCGKPTQTKEAVLMNPVDLLVVCSERLKLYSESQIAAYGYAILASHCNDCGAIVLEDLQKRHR